MRRTLLVENRVKGCSRKGENTNKGEDVEKQWEFSGKLK